MVTGATIAVFRGQAATLPWSLTPAGNTTGWTIVLTVRRVRSAGAPTLLTKQADAVNAAEGTWAFAFSAADLTLAPGMYFFDIWRTDSGFETPLTEGTFEVQPGVRV